MKFSSRIRNALFAWAPTRGPALGAVVLYRRSLRHPRFVGVTGSVGKTTAKDLCAAVLASRFHGTKSQGTLNSAQFLGIFVRPILRTRRRHDFCVIELGANGPGSLEPLIRVSRPDVAVVTHVRDDHLSAFRSLDAVAAEKGKIVAALPEHGTAVLNADEPRVLAMGEHCRGGVFTYGLSAQADLRAEAVSAAWPERLGFDVIHAGRRHRVRTRLCGAHQLHSALAALAVGVVFGVPLEEAIAALATTESSLGRMYPVVHPDGVTFIRDDWKAPVHSIPAALEFLRGARAARKILVLGTLSDYGGSGGPHYVRAARAGMEVADHVFFVGRWSTRCLPAMRRPGDDALRAFPDTRTATEFLGGFLRAGDLVLLKGTNRVDHLGRLELARRHPVACWRESCGLKAFCEQCRKLDVPSPARRSDAGSPTDLAPLAALLDAADGPRRLLVGLGNPGEDLADTPHNLGHRVVDELARQSGAMWVRAPELEMARTKAAGVSLFLAKPLTGVNRCGPLVAQLAQRLGIEAGDCLLVHDDVDLPRGRVRSRDRGTDGGHRGVGSVLTAFQSIEPSRVKVGVGRPKPGTKMRSHVLRQIDAEERGVIDSACETAATRVLEVVARDARVREARRGGAPGTHPG